MELERVIYVAKYHDQFGQMDFPYKKIGFSSFEPESLITRILLLSQLSPVKSPIKVELEAAWLCEDPISLERMLHAIFEHRHADGEWFIDDDASLVRQIDALLSHTPATRINVAEYYQIANVTPPSQDNTGLL